MPMSENNSFHLEPELNGRGYIDNLPQKLLALPPHSERPLDKMPNFQDKSYQEVLEEVVGVAVNKAIAKNNQFHEQRISDQRYYYQEQLNERDSLIQQLEDQLARTAQPIPEDDKGILSHIPTTYQIRRSKAPLFDQSIKSVHRFIFFVVLGLAIFGAIAIALPYQVLWMAAGDTIMLLIPFVFIAGLLVSVAMFVREAIKA
ncbi:hypothetical protein [cf. Phormidesmis sp. LEGE 11477]|uniref:hypothetical protein n=1 Tax=cf. Phormidesmis sp. LEGE 11477 TaxID=1828680 RepID=UPI0018821CD9|nr:hypothetical protein [cf. Phormidesmis sp. LEGE 11477]MBE9060113.1 hypothetical protein [cf. Phormidesmis sp. LEGE 11477]